ncbi:MAG: helix-turn-helix domain-containing protein [Oscillibacter sp.]|jgi:excisionase family DNA binding protein|nr:helix-turn-helix domain-containing protein [Oscillibacter sp.]MEA4993289.1 helix-turn-helix domain-containing protein [Oscillibacter sp.]
MSLSEQRQACKDMTEEVLAYRDILYTVPETAHLLRVNKNTVYDLINCGYLRSIKLGSRKVSRKAILEFVEQFDGKTVELPGVKSE